MNRYTPSFRLNAPRYSTIATWNAATGNPPSRKWNRKSRTPQVCIYLGESFLPRLYLAKVSGANCRIGFATENCYPFLNLSLHLDKSNEATLISQYYGVQ